ncbi:hypothetical protein F5146DRAFT_1037901 [Armillaria mellea]|nr:hypothetical protein F5146DRAFT_1037901 [Armillaria mellea]
MAVWGLDRDKPLNQVVAEVFTQSRRCIAFPNMYQHCVSSFSLLILRSRDTARSSHSSWLTPS